MQVTKAREQAEMRQNEDSFDGQLHASHLCISVSSDFNSNDYMCLNHGMCRFSATLMWYGWWEFCNHKRNEGRPRLCSAGLSSTPERMYDFLLNHFYSL